MPQRNHLLILPQFSLLPAQSSNLSFSGVLCCRKDDWTTCRGRRKNFRVRLLLSSPPFAISIITIIAIIPKSTTIIKRTHLSWGRVETMEGFREGFLAAKLSGQMLLRYSLTLLPILRLASNMTETQVCASSRQRPCEREDALRSL